MSYGGQERRRGGPDRRADGEQTRILIVDDHALFRVGISNILERESDFDVVGEADDSRSAVDRAIETSPDIILMDLSLPAPGGIETTQRIKRELPSTGIIVLAVSEDEDALFDAIKAGAAAFRSRISHQPVSFAPIGIASFTSVPPSGRECTSRWAPISSARSLMN
jgi:CheY-like chemotaxis protein